MQHRPYFREDDPWIYKLKQVDHGVDLVESKKSYKEISELMSMRESTLYHAVRKRRDEKVENRDT